MLNSQSRPDDFYPSEFTTGAESSLKRIYDVIDALSQAGRKDLSIQLRKHLPALWSSGSPRMPNPFILRKLSKQAEAIWLTHEVDKLTTSLSQKPTESYIIQRQLALKRSSYDYDLRQEIKVSVESKHSVMRFWVSTTDSFDEIARADKLLHLSSDDVLQRETRARILGTQRLAIGSNDFILTGTLFGCECTIRRSFLFHSSVEIETEITLKQGAHVQHVCAQLKKLDEAEASLKITKFIQLLQDFGIDEVLFRAKVPLRIDEGRMLKYLNTYSSSRSGLQARFREMRGFYKRLCLESGMFLSKLRLEGTHFWERLEATLEKRGDSPT